MHEKSRANFIDWPAAGEAPSAVPRSRIESQLIFSSPITKKWKNKKSNLRIKKWKKNMQSENFDHARTNIFIYVFRLLGMFSAAVFLRYVN